MSAFCLLNRISRTWSHSAARRLAAAVIVFFAGMPGRAAAGTYYNETVTALTTSGTEIIASDPARDGILVSGTVVFARKPLALRSGAYKLGFALLDAAGKSVALRDAVAFDIGLAKPAPVVFTSGRPATISGASQTVTFTDFSISPAAALDVDDRYRVVLIVAERTSALPETYVVRTSLAQPAGKQYWTWTGTDGSDVRANVLGSLTSLETAPAPEQLVAIRNVPGKEGFRFAVTAAVRRYDAFDVALPVPAPADGVYFPAAVAVRFHAALKDTTTNLPVALAGDGDTVAAASLGAFTVSGAVRSPVRKTLSRTLSIVPVNAADILPSHTYSLSVTLRHTDTDPSLGVVNHGTLTAGGLKLLSLSGNMGFGNVRTTLTAVTGNPAAGTVTPLNASEFFLTLTIPAGGGVVNGQPDQVFGGGPLTVLYDGTAGADQGNLSLYGDQTVQLLAGGPGTSGGVRWTRGPVVLSKSGAVAQNFRVYFPAGMGIAAGSGARLKGSAVVNVALSPDLTPAGTVNISVSTPSGLFAVAHERLPLHVGVKSLAWDVAGGTFTATGSFAGGGMEAEHVRSDEKNTLAVAAGQHTLAENDNGTRMSNDGFLGDFGGGTRFVVRVSPEGRALLDFDFQADQKGYQSHFPQGLTVPAGRTLVSFRNSDIASGTMTQTAVSATPLTYSTVTEDSPDCVQSNAAAASRTVNFTAAGGVWQVTADGGLRAAGTIGNTDVAWGLKPGNLFTHTVQAVGDGSVRVAGIGLSRSVYGEVPVAGTGASYLPAALLLTGCGGPENAALVERPGTAGYDPGLARNAAEVEAAGRADYPGFNFRVGTEGRLRAVSHIAGAEVDYRLKGYSKYCLRQGGVTGVHDAVTADIQPLPLFYGYQISLDRLSLAYRDNNNVDSVNKGNVALPSPSGFTLAFKKLLLTSTGELKNAELDNPGEPALAYWNLKIRPGLMNFEAVNECATGAPGPILTLSVSTVMPAITPDPLQGRLGFLPDGELANLSNSGEARLDSRFTLPATLTLQGVNGGTYTLTTVNRAALNNHAVAGRPEVGFVSFAGAKIGRAHV